MTDNWAPATVSSKYQFFGASGILQKNSKIDAGTLHFDVTVMPLRSASCL